MSPTSAAARQHVRELAPADLLLVMPLVMRVVDGQVLFDLQSRDSLVRLLDEFGSVIVACPQVAESRAAATNYFVWVPVDDLLDRVQFVPLPEYGSIVKFIRDYPTTSRLINECIYKSHYLH